MIDAFVKRVLAIISAIMLITLGFFIGMNVLPSTATDTTPIDPVEVSQMVTTLTPEEQVFAGLYEQVSPSVVAINVVAQRETFNGTEEVNGSGSGFVIDQNGHIVTNAHVVDGATELVVNFFDGTITRAEIVGIDRDSDLAVIRVDLPADRLAPVEFGNVDNLVVGQTVLAIGSPFGQRWTLTSGIISALNRQISGFNTSFSIGSAIQTDTSINPGNSGGPLINMDGQVVGVNSQILSESGTNSGVGFAIPSDLVVRVANELIETGEVRYSYIGIGIGIAGFSDGNVSLALIEALDLPNDLRGVVIGQVLDDGPAGNAGLRNPQGSIQTGLESADIITAINGEDIQSFNDMVSFLARETRPGDTVQLTVYRDGQFITIPLTLADRPSN